MMSARQNSRLHGLRAPRALLSRIALWFLLPAFGLGAAAEPNYLHQSVEAVMLVADPEAAADRLEAWAGGLGGYTLYKSSERVSLRLPHSRLEELRSFLEGLSEDILEYNPQAVDLREQLSRVQSSLASRRDILARNLALLEKADTAGTLAIEREVLGLIQEVESLRAALQKLEVDRSFARVQVALRFEQSALPEDIPSSFGWINQVSFYALTEEAVPRACGRPRVAVEAPGGYAPDATRGSFRALSPEGLPFQVRTFRNEPEKSLAFWAEALETHLRNEGYRPAAEGRDFQAGNEPGRLFEWAVPYGGESWLYQTALLVSGGRIVLAEAAGPYALFRGYSSGIEQSLRSIRPR